MSYSINRNQDQANSMNKTNGFPQMITSKNARSGSEVV